MGTFNIISLGCPKNLVDSEYIVKRLEDNGFLMSETPRYFIINTCAFIEEATKESIETIFDVLQKKGETKRVIVTGCLVEKYKERLSILIPEVDLFVDRSFYPIFEKILDKKGVLLGKDPFFETFPRKVLTKPPVAYLKIQEGCDNNCTYCTIPKIRGPLRCRRPEQIKNEFKWLLNKGFKEINVVGQDITAYGKDFGLSLKDLLSDILKTPGEYYIRLLYLHPKGITPDLIDLVANEEKIIKYFDIPIQHSEDRILSLMRRNYTKEHLIGILETIRNKIPDATLRTSVIVGFPSETDEEFEALLRFIEEWEFDALGAFRYSREEGTLAAKMKKQLTKRVKTERFNKIMERQRAISKKRLKRLLGKKTMVIVEDEGKGYMIGRILNQAPEIDGVAFINGKAKKGEIMECKIVKTLDYDVVVEV